MITETTGLALFTLIGIIAGLGVILWLFTHDVGQCKVDHHVDPHLPNLPKEVDNAVRKVLDKEGRDNSELPPDEILDRYVMHRDQRIR